MKKILALLIFGLGLSAAVMAQDSTAVDTKEAPKQKFTKGIFNSTKIINLQSTEIVPKGTMQFMVSHHFSYLWNEGAPAKQSLASLFGLNTGVAHTYLSFDYSPLTWLNVGAAAAGSYKYEGFAKGRFMRQQTGAKNYPVSMTVYSMFNVNTAPDPDSIFAGNKFSFLNQLLISRKFSDKLTMEFIGSWIHFNVVPYGINNSNEVFNLGVAGKYRMTKTLNLTMEYTRQLNMYENIMTKNGAILNYYPDLLSAGLEINTGGHLFQFYIGNTVDASNIEQLAKNTSSLGKGNLAFGFTINRSF